MRVFQILVAAAALSACVSATAQESINEVGSQGALSCAALEGLDLQAKFDRREYAIESPMNVEIQLVNKSEVPIFIYPELDISDERLLGITIRDVSGQRVETRHGDHAIIFPGNMRMENLLSLNPGAGQTFLWRDSAEYYFPRPGKYSIAVTYQSPIPAEFYPDRVDLPFLECGSIVRSYDVTIK